MGHLLLVVVQNSMGYLLQKRDIPCFPALIAAPLMVSGVAATNASPRVVANRCHVSVCNAASNSRSCRISSRVRGMKAHIARTIVNTGQFVIALRNAVTGWFGQTAISRFTWAGGAQSLSTAWCMNNITESRSKPGNTFITSTATSRTTGRKICNCFRTRIMADFMQRPSRALAESSCNVSSAASPMNGSLLGRLKTPAVRTPAG